MNNSKHHARRAAAGRIWKITSTVSLLTPLLAFGQTPPPQAPLFTPGNLVVSVAGCGVYGGQAPNATPSTAACATPPAGGTGATTGTGPNSYGDDQGSPWNLWQYSVNGATSVTFVNSIQLPQNTSGANFPVSDDYGSQSEGTLQLSGNGKYLTMIGYGLNAATFNLNYLNYCPGSTTLSNACVPENGNPAMAQTGTLLGQTYSGNTPVPRVAVLIDANGNVNSSTVLYGIFNQNDARSAYSPDGVNIYVSGQGCKTWDAADSLCDNSATLYDNTQGVYLTTLGANNYLGTNNPIPITGPDNGPEPCSDLTTCTESQSTRMVQIYNGTLYISMDDKGGNNRSYIGTLGSPASTSLFDCTGVGNGCGTGYGPYGPAQIPGLVNTGGTGKYTINSQGSGNTSNGNNLNNTGLKVNLSPQNYFFASPTVLYVADTGSPKNDSNGPDAVCTADGGSSKATVGDGGLQKWILNPTVTAGVVNTGSTSAKETVSATSGAFTQGEVGLTITDSAGYIPAGTTITAVSGAGANATMSAAATGTDSTDIITVHGWSLVYTLYNGLNLVLNSDCDPSSPTTPGSLATTGLYGVTGTVNNGVATLYVTTYPNNDLVQSYLYGITDTLTTEKMTSPGTAFTLLDTAPAGSILRGVSFVPTFQNGDVAVTTVPSGLSVTSANAGCAPSTFTTPLTLAWTPGSSCQLSVNTPQAGPAGVQYAFAQWQDGTSGLTDTVIAPSSTATSTYTYTATFTTQYQLTTSAVTGGTVSAGGYYNAGTNATITATPSAGYYFVNFTVVDSNGNTTTPASNPLTLAMNGPETVTANFAAQGTQIITFNPLPNQPLGTGPFTVNATASSNLSVSFASLTTSVCTVSGAAVTLVTTGVCTIQAMQAGNVDYTAAAPVNQSFEVTSQGLGASSLLVGSAGGSSSVVLAYAGAWTAMSNASFLHISNGSATGAGNSVVLFTIDPFSGTGTQTGTLTIAGFTLTVTQVGANYIAPTAPTTLVSGLNSPMGTAVDGSGNVYYADSVLSVVEEWSAATQTMSMLVPSGLSGPRGVAVDSSGNVYIADSGNNAIKEWNAATQQVSTLVSGLNNPWGVAVDGVGNVYFADSGDQAIKEFNVATQVVTSLVSGLSSPSGVAVDSDGNVYFSDSVLNEVEEWTAATQSVTTLVPSTSGLNGPSGTAVDGSGNVYFADSANNAIKEWNASSQQVTTLAAGLSGPSGVAVDGSGDVYFADTGNQAIKLIFNAYVGPASGLTEPAAGGSDALLPVVPATASLTGIFAPASNQSWLTIGTIAGGVVNFSFTANTTTSSRTATITELGQSISVTQSGLMTQTITFNTLPNQFYGAAPFAVSATASSGLTVSFNSQTPSICAVSGNTVTLLSVGQCTIQATQGGNAIYTTAPPVSQSFQVMKVAGATYVGDDTTTQGTWTPSYGSDGYLIANEASVSPSYASVSFTSDKTYVWAGSTADPRALQTASNAQTRTASAYYANQSFTINVNVTDGGSHQLALYLLDWDSTARRETVSILDAATNALLSSKSFVGFHNGTYAIWNIQGNVVIQVTKTGGSNAVVAGIFFGPGVALSSSAAYSGLDTTTQGTWTPSYGSDGYLIAEDATAPPAYASVSFTSDKLYTWSGSTADPRALQTASDVETRIASTYYASNSFTINVNLTDGSTHQLALYLLDWDSTARSETVSILDAATNTLLSTQTFSNFHNGVYAVWNIKGNVLIQVTKTGGSNGVVAGIFFGRGITPSGSATYSGLDTTTQGNWISSYGTDGYLIAEDAATPPAYASVSLTSDKLYTWAGSTSDPRALQNASDVETRIASTYYSSSSFTIDVNLTDGNPHQLALYLLDWDSTARTETVSILDAATDELLSTQTFSNFHNGVYGVWNIKGNVVIQVTKTGGSNGVAAGIFFDPVAAP